MVKVDIIVEPDAVNESLTHAHEQYKPPFRWLTTGSFYLTVSFPGT
jgi:hypothetical protein